ncbi:MAG: hypothetical protein QM673_08685 [Gordonia sp. (in: high G+C Gram-positive bacteria)]
MTTSNGRSAGSRRSGRAAQWLLGLLIVLAVAASILMVFTDKISIAGSLAVIAALWAAVIGAILVTKFRRQAESAETKSKDLRLVYELQLEREIAARRQYELDVEATIRKEIGEETGTELAELKAQVLALRSSLEQLLGEALPDQRTALPSEKLRELASGLGRSNSDNPDAYSSAAFSGSAYSRDGFDSPAYGVHDDSAVAARDFAAAAPAPDIRHRHETGYAAADPNELTEIIPVITDAVEEPAVPSVDETPQHEQADRPAAQTESAPDNPDPNETADTPGVQGSPGRHTSIDADAPAVSAEPVGGHRRREHDGDAAHSAGLPVAELLNQLRQSTGGGGRRRRDS